MRVMERERERRKMIHCFDCGSRAASPESGSVKELAEKDIHSSKVYIAS